MAGAGRSTGLFVVGLKIVYDIVLLFSFRPAGEDQG
jgi:hypothetical protein